MAVTINASTSAGLVTSADTSGDLNIQSGGSTKIAVTSAGVAVTGLSKGSLPTGSVLQVVNVTYSTQVTSSSSTFADTGLTLSITPTSATSKILALVQVAGVHKRTGNTRAQFKLFRNSTEIMYMDDYAADTNTTANNAVGTVGTTYLDSPATTSSTTYKIQMCSAANTAEVRMNTGGGTSTITLMEIAA
jgi:hypothetical protein